MKKPKILFLFVLLNCLLFIPNLLADINFRVMTYNVLNFSEASGLDRIQYFQTIIEEVNPDIVIMQEMINEEGANLMLNALNTNGQEYTGAEFIDGYNTDNMFYYRTSIATLVSQDTIHTDLRDISEYVVIIGENEIRFYSCHLKAGQGPSNRAKRLAEVTILRNRLNNTLPEGTEFLIVGDMNFYYSNEPGYQKLIADEENNIGKTQDLIDNVGYWHNNEKFASVHTQSTRDSAFGGGASSGLDDRFDFIFASYGLNNSHGIEYINSSYTAFGNDGDHFNMSINYGENGVVSQEVANALYYASDHLPVYADFECNLFNTNTNSELNIITSNLNPCYPNPATSGNTIHFGFRVGGIELTNRHVELKVYNVLGELVEEIVNEDKLVKDYTEQWTPKDLPNGVYLYQLKIDNFNEVKKLVIFQ